MFLPTALTTLALTATGACAAVSSLIKLPHWGQNPTNISMYYYLPPELASPPPLIVALHHCTGTAQSYFSGTEYATLADAHGYIVLYPNAAPGTGSCWDVHSNATLTHNAGGDSLGVVEAVRYAITHWDVDPTRVFATGTSSGAMMTNVLMGAYPDVFAAGSAFSGVPYGCFAGPTMWNVQCALGKRIKTPQEWGDLVRRGYPDYTGTRPRFQFWHGTADHVLYPENFFEGIKQWTNVFGVSQTPTSNCTNDPHTGYSRASFGPNVQAILAQGVTHTVPEEETDVLNWFGLSDLRPSSRTDITGARLVQCDGAGCTDSTGAWSSPAVAPQCDLPVAFPSPVCAVGLTQTYIDPCHPQCA